MAPTPLQPESGAHVFNAPPGAAKRENRCLTTCFWEAAGSGGDPSPGSPPSAPSVTFTALRGLPLPCGSRTPSHSSPLCVRHAQTQMPSPSSGSSTTIPILWTLGPPSLPAAGRPHFFCHCFFNSLGLGRAPGSLEALPGMSPQALGMGVGGGGQNLHSQQVPGGAAAIAAAGQRPQLACSFQPHSRQPSCRISPSSPPRHLLTPLSPTPACPTSLLTL